MEHTIRLTKDAILFICQKCGTSDTIDNPCSCKMEEESLTDEENAVRERFELRAVKKRYRILYIIFTTVGVMLILTGGVSLIFNLHRLDGMIDTLCILVLIGFFSFIPMACFDIIKALKKQKTSS